MRLREAYLGFRALPLWVQVWVVVLLAPVNVVSLWFLDEPGGYVVAVLALGGVIPNFVIGVWQGGLSKFLEFWHFVVWPPLVVVLLVTLSGDQLGGAGRIYHAALLTRSRFRWRSTIAGRATGGGATAPWRTAPTDQQAHRDRAAKCKKSGRYRPLFADVR